jgi:hypothetical protein
MRRREVIQCLYQALLIVKEIVRSSLSESDKNKAIDDVHDVCETLVGSWKTLAVESIRGTLKGIGSRI